VILLAASSLARANAARGSRILPQGMCLAFVHRMFGSPGFTGYAKGQGASAMTSWNATRLRAHDRTPPAGAPVYFGVSPTRTDRNKYAGDVTIAVGGGSDLLICTDASGATVGVMTIRARELQTQRPYLGYGLDFGGREIQFGVKLTTPAAGGQVIITPQPSEEDDMKPTLILVQVDKDPITKNPGPHWFVQNFQDHTFWWVPTEKQKNYLAGCGMVVKENQNWGVLEGFRQIA
jgi:hypothetical protein